MQAGLMNTYQHPVSNRHTVACFLSGLLFVSYILLYFGPIPALGIKADVFQSVAGAVGLKSKWTLYGLLYSVAMVAGGLFVLRRHGNTPYQRVRTLSVVSVQVYSPLGSRSHRARSGCNWSHSISMPAGS